MRLTTMLPAVLGALLLGGCNDLDVGDLNSPGAQPLQESATRSGVLNLATGLQVGSRYNLSEPTGYNVLLGMLGREVYNLAGSDPRFFGEMITGPMQGGTPAFGGNLFVLRYSSIRTGTTLLGAIAKLPTDPANPQAGLTTAEKEAITGYTYTLLAYDFLRVINTRDDLGAPVDVPTDPTGPPAPIKTKDEVFLHITNLLDSAVAHLALGGATFPFPLSEGYAGFDTPPTFIKFNRALRARVAAYLSDYATVARLLEQFPDSTFLDVSGAPGSFAKGVYHSFSGASGDLLNLLFDPPTGGRPQAITVNAALVTDAQKQVGGLLADQRILDKTILFSPPLNVSGVSSGYANNVYTSNTAPIPIIRNEELILLRAEERIFNSLFGPGPGSAQEDLDLVRTKAGKLPPYPGPFDKASELKELLYNRTYSLLFEGGHRWIDFRRLINPATGLSYLHDIPQEALSGGAVGKRFSRMPFPTNECLVRNPPPTQGCSPETGF